LIKIKTMEEKQTKSANVFESLASKITYVTGSTTAFIIAACSIIAWAIAGPLFNFSQDWQLVINTGTSIITFIMVFLIQKSQNKDSLAIQLKLNELVAAHEYASNRLVNVENMSEEELIVIRKYYSKLSEIAQKDKNIIKSHSIDEASMNSKIKKALEKEMEAVLNSQEKK
jgi:low affinity Fe/Cu permease